MAPEPVASKLSVRNRRRAKRILARQPLNAVVTFLLKQVLPERFRWRYAPYVPKRGLVRCPLPNGATLTMRSAGDDRVVDRVFWKGWDGYEPGLAPALYERAGEAEVFLDIGAHVGVYSLVAALANPRLRVFSFEPFPPSRARLSANIALSRLTNVEAVPLAAGPEPGQATLYHEAGSEVPGEATLSAGVGQAHAARLGEATVSVSVEVTTVDAFVAERGLARVDLVKIDTESMEPGVLAGMTHTLEHHRPVVFCEILPVHDTAGPIEDLLRPFGYRFSILTADGPERRDRIVPQFDAPNWMFEPS